jgi:hypothetical protein
MPAILAIVIESQSAHARDDDLLSHCTVDVSSLLRPTADGDHCSLFRKFNAANVGHDAA